MSKSVLLSIKPKYCELIASGKKTIEVRKTKPKLDTPFKCYIYCTKGELLTRSNYNGKIYVASSPKYQKALERNGNITLSGKVIGEFVCDNIIKFAADKKADNIKLSNMELLSCLSSLELENYAGDKYYLYGFHISDLVIYDKPKELGEFYNYDTTFNNAFGWAFSEEEKRVYLKRPPQSWCYVEELL